jgi:hypothetical protein
MIPSWVCVNILPSKQCHGSLFCSKPFISVPGPARRQAGRLQNDPWGVVNSARKKKKKF